jgi:hypothetical protein
MICYQYKHNIYTIYSRKIKLEFLIMDKIFNQIKTIVGESFEITNDDTSISVSNVPNKLRKQLHEFCEKNNLFSSSSQGASINKDIKISIMKLKKEINIYEFNKFFVESYKYPIEIYDIATFDYYVKVLIPFFPSIESDYNEMLNICESKFDNNIQKMKNSLYEIKKNIIDNIRKKDSFLNFMKLDTKTLKTIQENVSRNLFIPGNINKSFVRFDIVKAFFTTTNNYDPTIFDTKSWGEFISQFTDSPIYFKSKILREIIGGDLGIIKRSLAIAESYIATIYEKFKELNPVCVCGDAIVFESSINNKEIYKTIEELWPNTFRMEKFVLKGINTKVGWKYFEEHEPNIENPSFYVKIKCCEKKYIMQMAKYYQKLEIIDLDKKFFDNGMRATFDESIFF